jgi:light-regulated signal transduction histidine kinase (bacteriophytochrome)
VLQKVLSEPTGPVQWHARVCRKDGTYTWVESTVSNLLIDPDVQAIVINHRDVNARRAEETEKQRQAEELARANLQLEEFAYAVAHDLRDPLSTIAGFADVLVRRAQLDAANKEITELILRATGRMSRLIDDLLFFASIGANKARHRVELRDAVAQAALNLALAFKSSGAKMRVDPLPLVQGNESQLVCLFQNLIGNALKYRRDETPDIHVTAERRGPDWVIGIQDNGLGIAAEDQACLFAPFTRLPNENIPGTGLGLAVCKKIVEGLGGTIWLESQIGQGSKFCFTIMAGDDGRSVG